MVKSMDFIPVPVESLNSFHMGNDMLLWRYGGGAVDRGVVI